MPPRLPALPSFLGQGRRLSPLAIATVVSALNSLGIALVFAHGASAAAYGRYQTAVAAVAIAGLLALSGSAVAVNRAAAQGRSVAWGVFRARLPWCAAAAALLAAASAVVGLAGSTASAATLAAGAVALPLWLGGDVYPAELLGRQDYPAYLRFQLAVQAGTLIAVTALVLAWPGRPWLAVLAVGTLTGLLQLRGLRRLRASADDARADLRVARSFTSVSILSAVDARLDVVLTSGMLGAREAGVLAVARTIPGYLKLAWEVLNQAYFARLAGDSARAARDVARRHRWVAVAVLGGGAALAALTAPLLVPLLFGEALRDAVIPMQLFLAGTVAVSFTALEGVWLKAQARVRELQIMYAILPVIGLASLPVLLSWFGVAGAGAKALLVATVQALLVVVLVRRASRSA